PRNRQMAVLPEQAKALPDRPAEVRAALRALREDRKEETTVNSAAQGAVSARAEDEAITRLYLHPNLPKLPRTEKESATERIKIKRKISTRWQAAVTDRTREAAGLCPDCRRLSRSRRPSRSRKRRNRRLRKLLFPRSLPSGNWLTP